MQRCFQIGPAVITDLNADITFFFADAELSGNDCAALNAYRWNGSDWDELVPAARQCSTEPYSVTVTGVSGFSHFALKSGSGTGVARCSTAEAKVAGFPHLVLARLKTE